jgi:peptide/nickel transport system permease protein
MSVAATKPWRPALARTSAATPLSGGGWFGVAILVLFLFIAAAAPLLSAHSHRTPSGPALRAPDRLHLMGTDELGVDLWAQLCFGSRVSLLVGMGTALLAGLGGALAGILGGYLGGLADRLLMRLIDILLVLPDLPMMIVLAAFFGPSVWTVIGVLSMFSWVFTARIVRSRVLSLKERRYVHAAEINGAGAGYLLRRHFLPEIFPLAAVGMIRLAGRAIVAEAGLSFLGLGDPTSRSWGMIIHHALSFQGIYYTDFWKWWLLFPWLALVLVVTALALVGRDLEKAADPRMRMK